MGGLGVNKRKRGYSDAERAVTVGVGEQWERLVEGCEGCGEPFTGRAYGVCVRPTYVERALCRRCAEQAIGPYYVGVLDRSADDGVRLH